jgi:adenine-specific DNA-methyltransferase
MYVRLLMNEIFGEENFRNEIDIKRGLFPKYADNFPVDTENLLYFCKNQEKTIFNIIRKPKEGSWNIIHLPGERKDPSRIFKFQAPLPEDIEVKLKEKGYECQKIDEFTIRIIPPKGRRFQLSQEKIDEGIKSGKIRLNPETGDPEAYSEESILSENWTDILGYSTNWGFKTENSEILLKRVIESSSNEGDLVMDFFLGIGTTTGVAHKLKRKWIGIEMGEHFWDFYFDKGEKKTGILGRMKEVLAGSGNHEPCGISKEIKWQGGGFFKYYELEQYEEILRKAKYLEPKEQKTLFDKDFNYIFSTDPKMLDAIELDYENNKVKVDLTKIYPEKQIDIAETLSNLKGKWIKRISKDEVEFEDGEKIDVKNLDYRLIKNLIWW